ncbi:MAG: acetyl-CoA carboxylase biotin carboxyl carrier protein [Solirubrobacteraceae bacterium]
MPLSDEDIREILRIIDQSDLAELKIETDDFSLYVRKGAGDAPAVDPPGGRRDVSEPGSDRARGRAKAEAPPQANEADGSVSISAPILGTFYRAEAPGKPPFVEVGSRVEPDTIVCIIEVMKMMNSVPAGVSGTVAEVVAENAQLVEYGEPLFRVEPA